MNNLDSSQNLATRRRASYSATLLLLAGCLAVVTPLRADNPPTYLFQIDSSAAPNGFHPQYVGRDTSNNVYVADGNNDRVLKFDRNGNYLTQWGSYGSGNGQFSTPVGIAVDSSNNVYVVDIYNERIEKFDSSGNYLTQWGSEGSTNGQFSNPEGIAVDSSNNVYVADTMNNRIEKFDRNGNYLTQWGSGEYVGNARIVGIAVDSSNNVYVVDTDFSSVLKFDSNGNYLTSWGASGSGNGQFIYPIGVAVDSSNNVYVADTSNDRVEKFTSSGTYLTQWGSYGSGNGQFSIPVGIAVDSSNNVYVADTGNDRIEVFVNNTSIIPPPLIITTRAAFGFTNGVFGFNVTGPSGSNVVIQASTDLKTWIPLQTNLLGSSPLYFSDPESTTNVQRFYRAHLSQ